MTVKRITATVLAALGALGTVPLSLALLDFSGAIEVFNIETGDTPHAVHVIAGIAGVLLTMVGAVAVAGAWLAAIGSPAATPVLVGAALAGLVAGFPFWLTNAGMLFGAAWLARVADEAAPSAPRPVAT